MTGPARIAAPLLALGCLLAVQPAGRAEPLGSAEILVVGLAVDLDTRPDLEGLQYTMTAVKDIPSGVLAVVGLPDVAETPSLSAGALVKAELSGPSVGAAPVTVSAPPNQLLELPIFVAPGDHCEVAVRTDGRTERDMDVGTGPPGGFVDVHPVRRAEYQQANDATLGSR